MRCRLVRFPHDVLDFGFRWHDAVMVEEIGIYGAANVPIRECGGDLIVIAIAA